METVHSAGRTRGRAAGEPQRLSLSRAELGSRILFDGLSGAGECVRRGFAPLDTGTTFPERAPADLILDALVFGPPGAINVAVYPAPLRDEFREYLLRADAYRTTRTPAGGMLAGMVDHARIRYERAVFAAAGGRAPAELVVALVDSLKPCYEWEGFHDCPEHDAIFADAYLAENPTGPFSDFLPLFSAHRWLCAAEAYETEQKPADAARSMRMYRERLDAARASRVLLFRTAAERLRERGTCYLRG
jgi:hypothetical protein